MILREKIYYPTNQIITGLYTSGSELEDENNNEYIGHYHTYINDAMYSDYEYNKATSFPLKKIIKQPEENKAYSKLTNRKYLPEEVIEIELFLNDIYVPKSADIKKTFYLRYFLKRKNSKEFKEINKKTLDDLKGNKKVTKFFDLFEMEWSFMGEKYDYIRNGMIVTKGYQDENIRKIHDINNKYHGFSQYIMT